MPQRWIVGLASGSSADGVDAALLHLEGVGLEVRIRQFHGLHQPLVPELRDLLRRASGNSPCEPRLIGRLHRLLGETYAAAARAVVEGANVSLQKVQAIGCAGHTAAHDTEGRFPSALILGMPAVLAERCGVSVVSDFRTRDLAAGGQGSPLTTLAHHILFRHPQEGRLFLHLGSMARLIHLPPGGRVHDTVGFEAGPCNLLLNTLVRQLTGGKEAFDTGGKHAVQGRCIEPLLLNWLSHPALQRRPPRCVPRDSFGEEFARESVLQIRSHQGSLHDLLCTATHFVARGVAAAVRRFLPAGVRFDRVLLTGGGVRNGFLWHLLEQQFAGSPLGRTDDIGVPAELCNAVSYGVLAALTLDGVPGNLPGTTGAAGSRLLGSVTPGSSLNWARCLQWMAREAALPVGSAVPA